MAIDPILEELHQHREQMLRECNNDPREFFRRLEELLRATQQPVEPPPLPHPALQRVRYARR